MIHRLWSGLLPALIITVFLSVSGCSRSPRSASKPAEVPSKVQSAASKPDSPAIDLQKVKPNELGKVLILEYHDVSDTEARWSRHYTNFQHDLQRLYQAG